MKKIKILLSVFFVTITMSLVAQCYDCPDLPSPIEYPRYWEDPDGISYELNEIDVFVKTGTWICYEDLGDGQRRTLFETLIDCAPPIEYYARDDSKKEDIILFPNPVQDELTVKHPFNSCQIFIQDVQGKVLFNSIKKEREVKINTAQLAPGIYFLSINADSKIFHSNFIVQ
ncbi:MAG: T9SS type A sorting domain-containing protein [Saprospiraceae bacterium]|nr:T9SS type A sorting domain-containing protein [Bacteroidia bacterium]NNE15031.1 T9SS type A sorting domain-containing protein [Saprospiraceae bacterium]NNL91339.1 T9SS type A sorting domain-containing protein [Saprospiraceae bacterium]